MIAQDIDKILDAESSAEENIRIANERADQIIAEAEDRARQLIEDSKARAREIIGAMTRENEQRIKEIFDTKAEITQKEVSNIKEKTRAQKQRAIEIVTAAILS